MCGRYCPKMGKTKMSILRKKDVALSIASCTKAFSGLVALSDVSMSVETGKIVGLIGPNGAGKTTLFNVVAGVYKPDIGDVKMHNEEITGKAPEQICRMGISRTFQIPKPFLALSVRENVMVGTSIKRKYAQANSLADEICDKVGLSDRVSDYAIDLTVPELRKLEFAKALSTDPEIILLDEVMAGLRPNEVELTIELVRELNNEGISFVVIEHNIEAVMKLCDKICVLSNGRKIAEGSPLEVARDPDVITAYLGDEHVAINCE